MTIKYHFFGKEIQIDRELSDRKSLNNCLAKGGFGENQSLFLSQIHSNKVCIIDGPNKIHGDQNLPKADAIITNQPNINIGVVTADCAPVLFSCTKSNIIAAAHAGWKGAKSGIINNTIAAMKDLGATDISAVIGPMIQQRSYEVSRDLYEDFLSQEVENKTFFRSGKTADKWQFDLNSYVEHKIKKENLDKINNIKIDTYLNPDKYFSYRRSTHRSEDDCGRNVSIISQSLDLKL